MYNKKERKNSAFLKLIFPYACVLFIPILVWFVSNIYVNHTNEEKWISFSRSNIESNIKVVDSTLKQIENVVYGITQNEGFDNFYKAEKPTFEEMLKFRKMLSSYDSQLEGNGNLYIYSNSSDAVITPLENYRNPEEFFMYSQPLIGFGAENWAEEVRSGKWASGYSHQQIRKNTEKGFEEVLSYVRNVPIEYIKKRQGLIGIYIKEDKLLQGFDALLEEGKGELYVFNLQGKLIMSSGDKFLDYAYTESSSEDFTKLSIGGENFYRLSCNGEKNQWQYVVFVSGDYVLKEVSIINLVLNLVNVLTLILGLLLCIYFTYGRNKSYVQILNMLGIEDEFYPWKFRFNEFEYWKLHLGNLLSENKKIKENVKELSEIGQYKALHMLLSGFKGSDDEAYVLSQSSGLDFQCRKFLVIALEGPAIYNVDGINNKNLFLKQVLKEYINEDLYLYIENSKTSAVIVNYDMDTEEMYLLLKEQIAKINLEVFYRCRFDVIWGISKESVKLSEICNSYSEAMEVVRYKKLTDSNDLLFYRELPKESVMYDYPIELENRFIQAISGGKAEEAFKVVDIIYENNFEKRTLPAERIEELFGEVSSTLNKIKLRYFKDEYPVEYKISDFTVKRFFEYVKDFVYSLCESVKIFDEKAYKTMFEDMIAYINENYYRSELSLTSLAEQFGFTSVSYISRSFKSFVNENFSSYLEKIRIEKACEMLLRGVQIKDVSERVGYISDVTFRRAFKKRMGLSPTEYVKKRGERKK